MLIDRVFAEAEPFLRERKIGEVYIGLTVIVVSLDNGAIGSTLVLLEEVLVSDPVAIDPDLIKNMKAADMAKWALNPHEHVVKRMLGIATMNACAYSQDLSNGKRVEASTYVDLKPSDTVGVIGWMRHLVQVAEEKARQVYVFDNGEAEFVYPSEKQAELLPTCDVVFISGTAFINQTIDQILNNCQNARDIIITGPTTPMYPNAYRDTTVTIIAGGVWKKDDRENIFRKVSLNAGMSKLKAHFEKYSVRL
ncbi:Rossmann-like domain-containing protein [Niallia sp. Krafla_26]|uniref:Rossmann-like domain-containing protein n=1 Tax=Niallia sp. Krafla_26 TaxID=3064703 RepID=UPI003D17177D